MLSGPFKYFGWRKHAWRNAPFLVFAGTVLLTYVTSFVSHSVSVGQPEGAWCVAFGAAYLLLGSIDFAAFCDEAGLGGRVTYLLVQGALLGGILWTSRLDGELPVCIYPLIGVSVALFPRGWPVAVFGVYALTLGIEWHFYDAHHVGQWALGLLPAIGFVVIFTLLALRANAARMQAEALSAEVERLAVIQERNRLAREIHDSLGHYLTTIHVQLQGAQAVHASDPSRAMEAVAKAQGLARDALVEVRRSVEALKADTALVALPARLRDLAGATAGWGAAVTVEVLGEARTLPPAAEHAIFRSAQEGLTNVRKHARATAAQVILDYREPDQVSVRVADDGCGAANGAGGHGLAGLRARIEALGGRVVAENRASGGFRLQVEIPA